LSIYLDTSLLVSLYSTDSNTEAAVESLEALPEEIVPVVSVFAELETVNALEARLFRGEDTAAEILLARSALEDDIRSGRFRLAYLPEAAFSRARDLSLQTTAKLGTRAGDLLHVAIALELGVKAFYCFDRQQRELAQAMKLKLNQYRS
jgi:predicted nucleic acid-binding protein